MPSGQSDASWRKLQKTIGTVGSFVGHAATGATDGTSLFQPTGPGATAMHSLNATDGAQNWFLPTPAQGLYGPATLANGVVYTTDQGILSVRRADTGAPLLERPLSADAPAGNAFSADNGVAVARNRVYASGGDHIVAYELP